MDNETLKKAAAKNHSRDLRRAVLFGPGNKTLSPCHPCNKGSLDWIGDSGTSARQSQGEERAKLHELSEKNSKLVRKMRVASKRGVELQREVEKCPIKSWWEVPIDRLSLEELKLHKRRYGELSNMLIQAIGDRTTDSNGNNSDVPPTCL